MRGREGGEERLRGETERARELKAQSRKRRSVAVGEEVKKQNKENKRTLEGRADDYPTSLKRALE